VRVRINGGKTAGTDERLFPHLRGATEFCAAVKTDRRERDASVGHDEVRPAYLRQATDQAGNR
jgi:hypothetical protein